MVFTSILSPICLLRSALVVFSAGFFAQTVRLFACRFKLLLLNATNYGIETSYTFSEQTSPVYYDPDKNKLSMDIPEVQGAELILSQGSYLAIA